MFEVYAKKLANTFQKTRNFVEAIFMLGSACHPMARLICPILLLGHVRSMPAVDLVLRTSVE